MTSYYIECRHCTFVGDRKEMSSHNDMGCLRKAMGREFMAECGGFAQRPKSPTPDRKF